jgi:hypothetical protein
MKANILQGLSIVDSQMIIMHVGGRHDKKNHGCQGKSHFPKIAHDMCHFCVGL